MKTIGSRIARIIEANGLKKVQFASDLNIDQSYVTQLVADRRVPSVRLIESICSTYSINRKWLETGEGEMYVESDQAMIDRIVARYNGSDVFRAILEVYITLPEDKQRAVEEFVARLLDYKEKGIPTDTLSVDDLPRPAEQARPGSAQAE